MLEMSTVCLMSQVSFPILNFSSSWLEEKRTARVHSGHAWPQPSPEWHALTRPTTVLYLYLFLRKTYFDKQREKVFLLISKIKKQKETEIEMLIGYILSVGGMTQ